jgi:hypothetical protein
MNTSLKIILSAVGVAAMLASPAMAKSHARTHYAPRALSNIPYDARGSVEPYRGPVWQVQPWTSNELNGDFQLGGGHGN